jgi:hypothetical protein
LRTHWTSPVTILGIGIHDPSPNNRLLPRPPHFRMQHHTT